MELPDPYEVRNERPSFAQVASFAKNIFGIDVPTMDVIPYRADLQWLRKCGEYFQDVTALPFGRERGCYMNASDFTETFPGSQYVQGFVLSEGLIFGHAWCVDSAGKAIEVTWPRAEGVYFGVRLDRLQLSRLHVRYETYDWYEGIATSGCL